MKHELRKILYIGLIITLAAEMPLVVFAKNNNTEKSSSSSALNAQIEENKNAVTSAENSKNALAMGKSQAEAIINSLEYEKDNLEDYVVQLDENLNDIQDSIAELNQQIDEKEKQIEETKNDLILAKEDEQKQYEAMRNRVRFMYETKETTILDVLFGSEGIKDLLNKAEYIEKVTEYDRNMLDELIEQKKKVAQKEKQLETENKELLEKKEEIEAKEVSVSELIEAKETEISQYNATIASKEEEVKEYENMIAAQNAQIKALEATINAQMAALEELARQEEEEGRESSDIPRYDGGKFSFPAPEYTRVSDDYGNRIHPTLGVEQFHNGIDLAAPNGSPILAAYSGTVAAADYSSTMGNYIMINHGDGMITIYMHASSLLVSTGDHVEKGQKIALVGSTGRSTGPHLHFSVRANGNYVSPWNYIK